MKALITIYKKLKSDSKLYFLTPIIFIFFILLYYFPYWGSFFIDDITMINGVYHKIMGLDIYVTGPIMILILSTIIINVYDNIFLKLLFGIIYIISASLSTIAFIDFEKYTDFLIFLPQLIILILGIVITFKFQKNKKTLIHTQNACPIFSKGNIIFKLILGIIIINIFGRLYIKLFI